MLRKNLKIIFAFLTSLVIATFALYKSELDGEVDGILSYIFPIFFSISVCCGIWLYIDFSMNKNQRKPLSQKEKEERENQMGTMEVAQDKLVFYHNPKDKTTIDLAAIKLIGEMTTEADTIAVDWYLILLDVNNQVFYLPAYAKGFDSSLKALSKHFDTDILPKLFSSVHFKSNVLFPKELAGSEIFEFEGLNSTGFWTRMKVKGGLKPVTPRLLNEIILFKPTH